MRLGVYQVPVVPVVPVVHVVPVVPVLPVVPMIPVVTVVPVVPAGSVVPVVLLVPVVPVVPVQNSDRYHRNHMNQRNHRNHRNLMDKVCNSCIFVYSLTNILSIHGAELSESLSPSFRHKHLDKDGSQGADRAVEQEQGVKAKLRDHIGNHLHQNENCCSPKMNS